MRIVADETQWARALAAYTKVLGYTPRFMKRVIVMTAPLSV